MNMHLRGKLSGQNIARVAGKAVRTFGPGIFVLALATAAHAQGTVDLSGVTTAMSSVEKTAMLGGAIAVIIGIVFGVFQFMGRNYRGWIPGHRRRLVRRHRHRIRSPVGRFAYRPECVNDSDPCCPGGRLTHANSQARRTTAGQSGAQQTTGKTGAEPAHLDGCRDCLDCDSPPSVLPAIAFHLCLHQHRVLVDRPQAPQDVRALGTQLSAEELL